MTLTHQTPPFKGWPAEAKTWFEGLMADNSRSYFQANRPTYDRAVRQPFESLLVEVEDELGEGRVFRPNRDVRFSADKSPYKTQAAASVGRCYVAVSAEGLMIGAGYYQLMRDQLDRYRRAVADDASGRALEEAVGAARKAGYDIGGETLATAPRGYPRDHPRVGLLRHKGIYVWRQWPWGKWLSTAAAKNRILAGWRDSSSVIGWLDKYVGPTTEPMRER